MRNQFAHAVATLLVLLTVPLLSSCNDRRPAGQAIAAVSGVEVTERELQQEVQVGATDDSEAALRALIARKVLAQEAYRRGLDRDARYHFDLRRQRERLLVAALERDLLASVPPIPSDQLRAKVLNQPWRFANRFVLEGETPSGDLARIDSFAYRTRLPSAIAEAVEGTRLSTTVGTWTVRRRIAAAVSMADATDIAQQEFERDFLNEEAASLVAKANDLGLVRYRIGSGPGAAKRSGPR